PLEFEGTFHRASAAFSPDSRRVLYSTSEGDGYRVVVDSTKLGLWASVAEQSLTWSKDGLHYAYSATDENGGVFVVRDNTTSQRYDTVVPPPLFSDDGSRLAYVVGIGPETRDPTQQPKKLVVNDRGFENLYERIDGILMLPENHVAHLGQYNGKRVLAIDDVPVVLDAEVV